MVVTKDLIRDQLLAYLNQQITLVQLVDWADIETLSDILARLGLADVREFGLSWEDCATFLARLGYQPQVEVISLAA